MRKVIVSVCVVVGVSCLGYLGYYFYNQHKNSQVYEEIEEDAYIEEVEEEVEEAVPEAQPVQIPIDFAALKATNPDIYAWIELPGLSQAYPIVQSGQSDAYYLDHTIDHVKGLPGSIYTEAATDKDFSDYNSIIYGHDMKDGSMFGSLDRYRDPEFMKANDQLVIYTEDTIRTYQLFSAVIFDDRHLLYSYDFGDPQQRLTYLSDLHSANDFGAVIRDDVVVNENTPMITLSVCTDAGETKRMLVGAVLVDEKK